MVTAADIQNLIVAEVGDSPDQILATLMPVIWQSYEDKQALGVPRLQELYSKRRAIDIILASLRNQVTFGIDGAINLRLGDRTKYLQDRRAETTAEITRWEAIARANRPGAIAQLVNTEPEPMPTSPIPVPPPGDALSPVYRGDSYWPAENSGPFSSEPGSN